MSHPPVLRATVSSSPTGGGRNRRFDVASIIPLLYDDNGNGEFGQRCHFIFEHQCKLVEMYDALAKKNTFVAVDMNLATLVPYLTRPEITAVAIAHGFRIYARLKVDDAKAALLEHSCVNCPRILTILDTVRLQERRSKENAKAYRKRTAKPPPSEAQLAKVASSVAAKARLFRYERKVEEKTLKELQFPPPPASEATLHQHVQPSSFLERGCALDELTALQLFKGDLSLLVAKGVTRKERLTSGAPIEELDGPILAEGCTDVCVECEVLLGKRKVPRFALANHNWLGLKIRHNRCVIRVNSGRPILKILAFVFTGSAAPTQEDFERTPMLVRKQKVVDALEWLKLNHISAENLASYKDRDIPVVVDYRKTDGAPEHSIPAIARSHGTASGECTFAVHGLTGAEFSTAPMSTIKAVALTHLTNKGAMLGIGRSDTPESMYNNVGAYPGMFPWLFPYGKGGIGHERHKKILSDKAHKKNLLMYHDKRFQFDMYFPMLKGSALGSSLLVKRRLLRTNPEVAANLADRMAAGEHKQCFALLGDLDGIGAHVKGNEIWSTTAFISSPTWFITAAWEDLTFYPTLRKSDERYKLIFFHYMVTVFLEDGPGLFGHTDAYYGTVEQQGRLTLHLHLLLWIKTALTPQQIRDRLMSEDSSCHQGEFIHGSMAEVKTRVKTDPHPTPEEEDAQSGVNYKVPTQTLPSIPPPLCTAEHGDESCDKCEALSRWWVHYEHEVDDLILRSNVHTCRDSVQDKHEEEGKKDWRGLKKKRARTKGYYERRGCLSKTGVCKARFPRDLYEETHLDKDGHVNIKKKEAYINNVNRVLTYVSRSNTDVTSLLSGTSVKAVISYVSDYVSKFGLKTYQAFASVFDVFQKNSEILNSGATGVDTSKNLMRQMINSMSTKLEIGSPMAAMYMLGNPDHYKSHTYVNFPWRTYVSFVQNAWKVRLGHVQEQEDVDDMLLVKNVNGTYVASSCIDDYRYRPVAYEHVTLYEWIQCSEKKPRHAFLPEHKALYLSHSVHCDFRKVRATIPNFLGGAVPRSDRGDRDYYCATMLTMFKAWRSPVDVKDDQSTWDQAFQDFDFSERQRELIANFNLRYECNDARDDHYAIMRKKLAARGDFAGHAVLGARDDFENDVPDVEFGDEDMLCDEDILLGYKTRKLLSDGEKMRSTLQNAKWLDGTTDGLVQIDTERYTAPYKTRGTWTEIIKGERSTLLQSKLANIPPNDKSNDWKGSHGPGTQDKVEILPHDHFNPKRRFTPEENICFMAEVCAEFSLNEEQERAFRIFVTHASAAQPAPLKMYLGGMGGLGKSQVFHAIIAWFVKRNEEYRFVVLGPTGSTAALLNGSTYHSMFKIPRETKSKNQDDIDGVPNDYMAMAAINERLQDEVSMVSCNDLQGLASQAAKARNIHDVEFGRLSLLLGGDFAQLPPMSGASLYSGAVALNANASMNQRDQHAILGRILWHQFTTVVLLRQNMRQRTQTPLDAKLRTALENMRYVFLESRVASDRPGYPHLDSVKYRNVSVITALNIHKDIINRLGAERFAKDTGQELVQVHWPESTAGALVSNACVNK
ncbi:PIF1-like helicase-domain-containing protein [Mycena filopes]|nr:PIF1-like helicase-domain-containing protein [Mycena filopes]